MFLCFCDTSPNSPGWFLRLEFNRPASKRLGFFFFFFFMDGDLWIKTLNYGVIYFSNH
jgi:hypothetical protein